MKNIHILPTDKPSILIKDIWKNTFSLVENFNTNHTDFKAQHIIIISDEEIKVGDWFLSLISEKPQIEKEDASFLDKDLYKKIILTTDQDLIKDGVQAIDDEFLEWFIKNPSCEKVDIIENKYLICNHCDSLYSSFSDGTHCDVCVKISKPILKTIDYTIIIPKEEPFKHSIKVLTTEEVMKGRSSAYEFIDFDKQETLEEAFEKWSKTQLGYDKLDVLRFGAKWQAERMYSEEVTNHLKFIYDRMVNIHNENENYDYMIKFKNIIIK